MDMLLSSPSFAFIQELKSISLGMNLFIIAAGLSLIFGVLRVINFAHGVFSVSYTHLTLPTIYSV